MTRHAWAESESTAESETPGEPAPAESAEQRNRARTSLRRRRVDVPIAVWLVTALWGSLLLGASLLWPMTYGYDEPQHIDMAYVYSADPFHFYGSGELQMTNATIGMQRLLPGYPPGKGFASTTPAPRGARPSFAELGGHTPSTSTQPDQMVQHPPLYYWAEAVVLRLPGVSHLSWDVQVWLMRLLSVLFMLPVPVLCWAAARRVLSSSVPPKAASRTAMLAAVVPLTIPNLVRDGSSVSNDSLLILTTSVLIYLLCRVLTGDLTRRTAIWVSVSLAAALLTKGFALIYPPLVLLTYLVGARHTEDGWRARLRAIAAPVGIAAIGGAVGGLWWLRNVVVYGTVQINGFGPRFTEAEYGPPDHKGTLIRFVPRFVEEVVGRIWGGVGLPDSPSTGPFIVYGWFFVVLIGLLVAVFARGGRDERRYALVLVAFPVLTLALTAVGSFSDYSKWSSSLHGTQGRYVYHVIVAIAVLAAIGWQRALRPHLYAKLTGLVLAAAVITNAVTWFLVLRTWYQPKGTPSLRGLRDAAHGLLAWSPVPEPVTVSFVCVLPVLFSVVALWAVRAGSSRGSEVPDDVGAHAR